MFHLYFILIWFARAAGTFSAPVYPQFLLGSLNLIEFPLCRLRLPPTMYYYHYCDYLYGTIHSFFAKHSFICSIPDGEVGCYVKDDRRGCAENLFCSPPRPPLRFSRPAFSTLETRLRRPFESINCIDFLICFLLQFSFMQMSLRLVVPSFSLQLPVPGNGYRRYFISSILR